ncbi:serine palmitoyltransferase 2 isoform X2 [Diorhabda carinulata]|uniref:serine palmitoyltransferase 2 isoform X2 n=1 Tax=Diorhabda carinulata TaxID=1163345 RepID=UPI0025A3066C|nr:serine palmitoyltransferase 2 isoform X2 [Diorhabda carinulata]
MSTTMEHSAGDCVQTELISGVELMNKTKSNLYRVYEETVGYTKLNRVSKKSNVSNGHVPTPSDEETTATTPNGFSISESDRKSSDVTEETPKIRQTKESFEPPMLITKALTHISFYILMFLGYLSQALFPPKIVKEKNRDGYASLLDRFSTFYSRYVYRRIKDCWNYPICSVPGDEVILKNRVTNDNGWTFEFTGLKTKCLNLASYNYLGFAEANGPCAEHAIKTIYTDGISTGNTRQQHGTCALHDELETLLAEFLGVEDAITFGMGFATNSLNIPTLASPGCLLLSDEKNHASLILGIKLSNPTVKVFKHNNVKHLEKLLKEAIYYGQPNQINNVYKPWKKIIIFIEGIYSMEGTICRLPEIIALKKKYKAYLYLDEAHSIGAMGKHGRGVVDYFNCDPKDIDVLMGTFTKSFGAAGGYIAGTKKFISFIREHSYASRHAWAMSPPVAAQIVSVLKIIMGRDGTNEGQRRIERLARNTRYFRLRLEQMGLIIHGNEDSPVVPILVYLYSKIASMVRFLIKEKIATVGVGYPATPLTEGRIRICLSASHTKEQLDYALEVIEKVADEIGLRYSRKARDPTPIDYNNIRIYQDLF